MKRNTRFAGVRMDATGASLYGVESPGDGNECRPASGVLSASLVLRCRRAISRGVYLTDSKLDATADLLHGLMVTQSRRIANGAFDFGQGGRGGSDRRSNCNYRAAPVAAGRFQNAGRRAAQRADRARKRQAERTTRRNATRPRESLNAPTPGTPYSSACSSLRSLRSSRSWFSWAWRSTCWLVRDETGAELSRRRVFRGGTGVRMLRTGGVQPAGGAAVKRLLEWLVGAIGFACGVWVGLRIDF